MESRRMDGSQREGLADDCQLRVVVDGEGVVAVGGGSGKRVAGGALLTAHLIIWQAMGRIGK